MGVPKPFACSFSVNCCLLTDSTRENTKYYSVVSFQREEKLYVKGKNLSPDPKPLNHLCKGGCLNLGGKEKQTVLFLGIRINSWQLGKGTTEKYPFSSGEVGL